MSYIYRSIENKEHEVVRYEVGYWTPPTQLCDHPWYCESVHEKRDQAAERVSYLNGGADLKPLVVAIATMTKRVTEMSAELMRFLR